jgi:hypothetical protein
MSRILTQSFANVSITEHGVDTASFLEASDGLVKLFGTLSITSPTSEFSLI